MQPTVNMSDEHLHILGDLIKTIEKMGFIVRKEPSMLGQYVGRAGAGYDTYKLHLFLDMGQKVGKSGNWGNGAAHTRVTENIWYTSKGDIVLAKVVFRNEDDENDPVALNISDPEYKEKFEEALVDHLKYHMKDIMEENRKRSKIIRKIKKHF